MVAPMKVAMCLPGSFHKSRHCYLTKTMALPRATTRASSSPNTPIPCCSTAMCAPPKGGYNRSTNSWKHTHRWEPHSPNCYKTATTRSKCLNMPAQQEAISTSTVSPTAVGASLALLKTTMGNMTTPAPTCIGQRERA
ncbi:Uncharacterised protein [Chlamydia trachomatis]|nr:Uncharacterised protein [Chlamydia trachomatis]